MTSIVNLFAKSSTEGATGKATGAQGDRQLSLFDFRPEVSFNIVEMHDLHGVTFHGMYMADRPELSVDFRIYPYFDMMQLGYTRALDIINRTSRCYLHVPTNLRSLQQEEDRWSMVAEIQRRLSEIEDWIERELATGRTCRVAVAFVDNDDDADLLQRIIALTDGSRHTRWTCRRLR